MGSYHPTLSVPVLLVTPNQTTPATGSTAIPPGTPVPTVETSYSPMMAPAASSRAIREAPWTQIWLPVALVAMLEGVKVSAADWVTVPEPFTIWTFLFAWSRKTAALVLPAMTEKGVATTRGSAEVHASTRKATMRPEKVDRTPVVAT